MSIPQEDKYYILRKNVKYYVDNSSYTTHKPFIVFVTKIKSINNYICIYFIPAHQKILGEKLHNIFLYNLCLYENPQLIEIENPLQFFIGNEDKTALYELCEEISQTIRMSDDRLLYEKEVEEYTTN